MPKPYRPDRFSASAWGKSRISSPPRMLPGRAAKAVGKPHKLALVAWVRETLVFASGTHWVKSAAVAYWSLAMRPCRRAHVAWRLPRDLLGLLWLAYQRACPVPR